MKLKLKDPWSAITHGIALLLAAAGAAPLLLKAAHGENAPLHITALAIFILTMILLYTASTVYHSVDSTEKVNRRLRKMDHMMIFVMIAGSYTPICLIALHNRTGYILCALVWSIAILGILLKGLWITCPKWLSSVLYIGMGWLCVLAFVPIFHSLPRAGFGWLLAGGIIYTIGGVIYSLKLPLFNARHKNFGSHERIRKRVFGHLPNTCLVLVQACHQTCTCRTRTGSIIKLSKTYTFRRQRINIGSKYFATITTDIGITHIIYQNQYDIRFLLCGTK